MGYRGKVTCHYGGGVFVELPARQKTTSEAVPQPLRVSRKAGPVFFNEGRQVLWLELDVGRSERGYRKIKLNDEPLRTDRAILAALTVLEGRPVDMERLHKELPKLGRPFEEPFWKQFAVLREVGWRSGRTMDLVTMLLRYHNPEFDRLTQDEQLELVERACSHVNEPCFICRMARGDNRLPENIIFEDAQVLVFLDGYPRAYGYTLVAPKEHREQVTGDFTMEEYLDLLRLIYRVTEAVREEVGAERMYLYTFGSSKGNSHVHWHVVPLPPGVPFEEQQGAWASWSKGVFKIPQEEMASLAARIGARLGWKT